MPDAQKEIERKYLIIRPDPSYLNMQEGAKRYEIEQIYLHSDKKVSRRIRQKTDGTHTVCTYTEKVRISPLVRLEDERTVTKEAYARLREQADPACEVLHKVRYVIPHEGRQCEIDLFPFWEKQAILEIECESEEAAAHLTLPAFVRLIRDVTDEPDYTSHSLAHPSCRARREIEAG